MQILSLIMGRKILLYFIELISLAGQKQFVFKNYFIVLLHFTCLFETCIPYSKFASCYATELLIRSKCT
jgi:hypothetical protein